MRVFKTVRLVHIGMRQEKGDLKKKGWPLQRDQQGELEKLQVEERKKIPERHQFRRSGKELL